MLNQEFDIDVDLSSILGAPAGSALIDSRWYELAQTHDERTDWLQRKIDRAFHNTLMAMQWNLTQRRRLDRRRAIRAPILASVRTESLRRRLVAYDISLKGLGCAGEPVAPVMNVEFKIPGIPFPIDTRVEVVKYLESNVSPLVGLRFVSLDRPYAEHIADYIDSKRRKLAA